MRKKFANFNTSRNFHAHKTRCLVRIYFDFGANWLFNKDDDLSSEGCTLGLSGSHFGHTLNTSFCHTAVPSSCLCCGRMVSPSELFPNGSRVTNSSNCISLFSRFLHKDLTCALEQRNYANPTPACFAWRACARSSSSPSGREATLHARRFPPKSLQDARVLV